MNEIEFGKILVQGHTPVALRFGKGHKLYVRVPYADDNRRWLQSGKRTSPVWLKERKQWELPQSWFNDFVNKCLQRYRRVYVVQPFRIMEKCSPACRNAQGHECQCSCMGANHGSESHEGWFDISDTFSFKWKDQELACRLLVVK
ncbi:hypothetical protein [Pseudochrobactrum sp. XF203]|uniref:hypothetical protein n=1 Tax=Pseudochrobactrum sp. XF203 TaxID=2879116 RepID=UPI001CE318FB|nr:hypothetical protein [Pseudochrobactrum sp. XF203]UCA46155.1 hypothetical protein LDL70_02525 [Pseudochrobactrum sp. XF203]